MQEEWRDVVGYEGFYQVSSFGQIKRIAPGRRTCPGKILSPDHPRGYARVALFTGSKATSKRFMVHILVATAFIGPKPFGYHTNHRDGNPRNNHADNLEYLTPKEHTHHTVHVLNRKLGPTGSESPTAKLTEDKVIEIRQMYATGKYYQRELAVMFGVDPSIITDVLNGRRWAHVPGAKQAGDSANRSVRRGSDNGNSVLNEDSVREIRSLYESGVSRKHLSEKFHVAVGTVSFIISRETWKHVK